jgi:hypothetical protein
MTIGAITRADVSGSEPSAPTFHDRISFAGDSSYPSGGTPTFSTLFHALTKDSRKILAVIGQDCGGYVVTYDETADKLKVWTGAGSAPLAEVASATNLSATTFVVVVVSQ